MIARRGGLGVAVALLVGCSASSPGKSCTLIGASSGVDVTFALGAPTIAGPSHAEVCVAATCSSFPVPKNQPGPWPLFVEDAGLSARSSVPVSVTVTDNGTGHVVFRANTVAPVHELQPNGPGCPPTVYQAQVATTPAGDLTAA